MNEPIKSGKDLRAHEQAVSRLEKELASWKTRLEEMKVKASLAKLEAEDRSKETLDEFERRYQEVRGTLREWKDSGEKEWTAASESLEAGWEKARDTYRALKAKRSSG